MSPPENDDRTDRVMTKIDSLIPELQSLLDDLRAEVRARGGDDGQDEPHAGE